MNLGKGASWLWIFGGELLDDSIYSLAYDSFLYTEVILESPGGNNVVSKLIGGSFYLAAKLVNTIILQSQQTK